MTTASESAQPSPLPDGREPDEVAADDFRRAMGRLPAGVTVISTRHGGMLHAMTATAFTSVSLRPPLVLVCVGHAARIHPAITAAGAWSVSILAPGQEGLAEHFAASGRELSSQFDRVAHHRAPYSGAALIEGAASWLDCTTEAAHPAGDHTILVGRVRAVGVSSGSRRGVVYRDGGYLAI